MKKYVLSFCALVLFAVSPVKASEHEAESEKKEEKAESHDGGEGAKEEKKKPAEPRTPEEVVRQKIKNLGDPDNQQVEFAMYGLQSYGSLAIAELIKVVADESAEQRLRINAIHTLGRFGKQAKPAIDTLLPLLKSKDVDMLAVTAIALGKIKNDKSAIVAGIVPLLSHSNDWVARCAEQAIDTIGTPFARDALLRFKAQKKATESMAKPAASADIEKHK